jgi:hypothetical protein
MRLRDIQHILQVAMPKVEVVQQNRRGTPAGVAVEFMRRDLENALRYLTQVDPLRQGAQKALHHEALKEVGEPTLVQEDKVNDFVGNYIAPLRKRGDDLLRAITQILPKEDPLSFSYQLPDRDRTIDDLTSDLHELQLIFDEPLARLATGRTHVAGLDQGSMVVVLAVISKAGSFIVAQLCKAAKHIMDLRHEHRQNELRINSMKLDLRLKEAQVEIAEAVKEQTVRALSEAVVKSAGRENDNEVINLIGISIERLAKQMEQGARVLLAANAPEDAKKLMPSPEDPPLLHEVVIKQLLEVNPSTDVTEKEPADDASA